MQIFYIFWSAHSKYYNFITFQVGMVNIIGGHRFSDQTQLYSDELYEEMR